MFTPPETLMYKVSNLRKLEILNIYYDLTNVKICYYFSKNIDYFLFSLL